MPKNDTSLVPDALWPENAPVPGVKIHSVDNLPTHKEQTSIVDTGSETSVDIIEPESQPQIVDRDWQSLAATLGLELYERQPEESNNEWYAWCEYRKYYPGKLPTMSELSKACGIAVGTLVRYQQKWSWKTRLLHWSRATDADIMSKRREAIKKMNEDQLQIADAMMEKLKEGVMYLDPATMRPNELTNMMKVVSGIQKDITSYVEEPVDQPALDANTVKQSQLTKKEDAVDVLSVLQSVGLLGDVNITKTEVSIKKEGE